MLADHRTLKDIETEFRRKESRQGALHVRQKELTAWVGKPPPTDDEKAEVRYISAELRTLSVEIVALDRELSWALKT
jgi:hypothetical protein